MSYSFSSASSCSRPSLTAFQALIYAASVAVAVVYGRYHYAVDSVAGFGVSLVALAVLRIGGLKK